MSFIVHNDVGAASIAVETRSTNELPEWLRVPAACRRFGISRSWLYGHISTGVIKSRCLRKRNATRGIRLVNRDSLAAFIENGDVK